MAHLVIFNSWGYINSFGVFQTYYVGSLGRSPSDISWVGSVQIFLLYFIATLSGRLTDAGYFRFTFFVGSVMQLLGVFMTSLASKYWQLFLAQGVCSGIGNGLVFCPALTILSTYFSSNRSLAISIAATGSATGGVVFPVIVRQLLPRIGFSWTLRALGFVMLAVVVVTNALMRPRLPPRRTGPLVEWTALKELPYVLFSVGMFLVFWGLYFAFYYVGSFGRDMIRLDQKDSISLLLIMNGVGVFGRLIPGYLANRCFGPLNCLIPVVMGAGLLMFCWIAVHERVGLIIFAVVYGFFGAGIQGLFTATIPSLTKDMRMAGVRMGMVLTMVSFACLTGAPIAGALLQRRNGSYLYAQIFAGSILTIGCLTLAGARIAETGPKFRQRM
ncbi:MAG: hypothetical protein M1832_005926 [Thelocarpon impressellum]|nr:MAG: hypothetical protein M1832_005926 [Thelocarpon impressellum]